LFLPNQDQGFDSYMYALDIRNSVELLTRFIHKYSLKIDKTAN